VRLAQRAEHALRAAAVEAVREVQHAVGLARRDRRRHLLRGRLGLRVRVSVGVRVALTWP